ncbi:hypothetical protein AEAC466_08150 [Asticcacaulis sp. AC466]|nr:hypothetical protein AEAC466_08150 [Asticcacaulis sp. AC466]
MPFFALQTVFFKGFAHFHGLLTGLKPLATQN